MARLRREVDEVRQELGARAAKAEQIDGLEDVLRQLKLTTAAPGGGDADARLFKDLTVVETPVAAPAVQDRAMVVRAEQVVQLEARVARLEKIVGLAEADASTESYRPVLETLQDVRQKLKLLTSTPAALDTAAANLRTLVGTIERLKTTKGSRQVSAVVEEGSPDAATPLGGESGGNLGSNTLSAAQVAKINRLYANLPQLEKLQMVLPKVLGRIKSLRSLHTNAESTIESIKDMDSVILGLKTDLKAWQSALVSVEEKLIQFEATSAENKQQIQEWVTDLKARQEQIHDK